MMHQSLYRKYRPSTFSEVFGQGHITEPLQQQLKEEKIGHAYLFAGSRGLGKTSVARIFARELGTSEKDIYEIDAASNNSVDNIRSLTENVFTLPFESKYKVYILDEAHMLSKSAWNAFLKTLEEPPAHAQFILATTELEKVPETVRSRTQVFEFKKPTRAGLSELVTSVAKKEQYTIEPSASELIALLASGSYRDSLSLLEKVSSGSKDKKITRLETEQITGAPSRTLILSLITALSKGDKAKALEALHAASSADVDFDVYLTLLLETLRNILLLRAAPELAAAIKEEMGADEYEELQTLILDKESHITHQTLLAFLDAASRMRFSPVPVLPLELAVLALRI